MISTLKAALSWAAISLLGAQLCAGGVHASPGVAQKVHSTLVDVQPLESLSHSDIAESLDEAGLDRWSGRYGVDSFAVRYRTIDASGTEVIASGLLAIPRDVPMDRLVSYQHSSATLRRDAPSTDRTGHHRAAVLAFAASGNVTVAADYVGLGSGSGIHAWLHTATEGSATRDMLIAVTEHLAHKGHGVPSKILLAGFSQGAHATMALADSLIRLGGHWRPTHIAAISGPFSLGDIEINEMLHGHASPVITNLALARLLVTAKLTGGIAEDLTVIFREPWHAIVASLFDGSRDDPDIVAALPTAIGDLFTARGMQIISAPSSNFRRWLRTATAVPVISDVDTSVRLLYSPADNYVSPKSTRWMYQALRGAGTDVALIDLGPIGHISAGRAGVIQTVRWFQTV